jgi:Flp pilus assembly protein TadG
MSGAIEARERRRRLGRRLRTLLSCTKGASAAEFAVVIPVIATVLTGTVDLAMLGNQSLVLDAAIRGGIAYALTCDGDSFDCTSLIRSAIQGYATNLGSGVAVDFGSTVTSSTDPRFCTWDNATTTAFSCSGVAACDSTQNQCPMHTYVKINAVWTLPSPLMSFIGVLPTTMTRTLTVRVQ